MLASTSYRYRENTEWGWRTPRHIRTTANLKVDRLNGEFEVAHINCYQPNTYYVPKKTNQPVVDSWTKEGNVLYFFQITISKTRNFGATEHDFFQMIRVLRKDIQIWFIYVVPSHLEDQFSISFSRGVSANVSILMLGVDVMESELDTHLNQQLREWELSEGESDEAASYNAENGSNPHHEKMRRYRDKMRRINNLFFQELTWKGEIECERMDGGILEKTLTRSKSSARNNLINSFLTNFDAN